MEQRSVGFWTKQIVAGWLAGNLLVAHVAAEPEAVSGATVASDPATAAAEIDRLVRASGHSADAPAAEGELATDSVFLRRAYLKLLGRTPTPDELTYFALDPDPAKRGKAVERLLTPGDEQRLESGRDRGADWAANWARYWRDALFARVQDRRVLAQSPVFETWLAKRFRDESGWDEIVREMVVATGDVTENGATALILSQQADPNNVAAEMSRLFMGIQIQCAQCHDHPYDDWRREQFHEMAAFFPRVRLTREKKGNQAVQIVASVDNVATRQPSRGRFLSDPKRFFDRFDADRDGRLERSEAPRQLRAQYARLVRVADKNKDGALTVEEISAAPINRRRPRGEHFMPDLDHPESAGTLMAPKFFTSGESPGEGTPDLERRAALASYLTEPENPWIAKAFVNRVWSELVGTGFVTPIDDLGPDRDVAHPEVFEYLSSAFQKSGYNLRWLLNTIARTRAFETAIDAGHSKGRSPMVCAMTRLRGDQLYEALTRALGLQASDRLAGRPSGGRYRAGGLRSLVTRLFGHDPSTPPEDIAGTIPQALFLMNSGVIANAIRARGDSALGELLDRGGDTESIVAELYLRVLSRAPTDAEAAICGQYVDEAPERDEALEDIYWSLLNSTEFLHHR